MPFFKFDNLDIYHDEVGTGYPLLLLHGNAVSSLMFAQEIEFYSQYFRVIYFDYPGHGKSTRLDRFHDKFWHYNALTAQALINQLEIDDLYCIGTSGGALVGLNLAILEKAKIKRLIADSFFGLSFSLDEALKIRHNRIKAKKELLTSSFWQYMHGDDWERVIDCDLDMMVRTAEIGEPIIIGDLSSIEAEVLAIASEEDELIPNIANRTIEVVDKIPNARAMVFKEGRHTFMITQREKFRDIAIDFLTKI